MSVVSLSKFKESGVVKKKKCKIFAEEKQKTIKYWYKIFLLKHVLQF